MHSLHSLHGLHGLRSAVCSLHGLRFGVTAHTYTHTYIHTYTLFPLAPDFPIRTPVTDRNEIFQLLATFQAFCRTVKQRKM